MRDRRPPRGTALQRPRGPLPAKVYWVRRVMVLVVVAASVAGVLGLVQVLTPGSDEDPGRAQVASAERADDAAVPPATTSTGPAAGPTTGPSAPAGQTGKPARRPKAKPDGPCVASDVVVTPTVGEAVGGRPITIGLELTTVEADACWWQVSPQSLTLRITSGDDEIWSSRQCPEAVPERVVVVRREHVARVAARWSSRRSDEGCTGLTLFALPGYYVVAAAALSGEPREEQFELTAPSPEVKTRAPEPQPGGKPEPEQEPGDATAG